MENLPSPRREHLDILYRWARYSSQFDLSDVLKKHNIHKIAIYGGGALGVALYENLAASLDIKYIIDRNPDLSFPYDGVQVIQPEQTEFLSNLDAVIVSIMAYCEAEEQLKSHVKCLWLDDLILDVDEYLLFEKVVQHISESKATLLMADLTKPLYYIKNPSFFEKVAKTERWLWYNLVGNDVIYDYYSDLDYSPEDIKALFSLKYWKVIERDGRPFFDNVTSKLYNIVDNCRLTTDVPDKYDNTIHFFGNCVSKGWSAEDQYTVESYLQRMLNKSPIMDRVFRIVNRSVPELKEYRTSFLQILNTPFQAGDYIVLISADLLKFKFYHGEDEFVKYINLSHAFDRPHEFSGEIFCDGYHMNHKGYKLIAKNLYTEFENRFNSKTNDSNIDKVFVEINSKGRDPNFSWLPSKKDVSDSEHKGLDEYLNLLRSEKVDISGTVGSIVMNCNPFTLGHRYLIEEAKKNCGFLYIFVVEEDKSHFPFADRFECVKEGVADIENVKVLPSGKFIISTLTFPEYFIKETSKTTIDASLDVKLFAERIAPILNITKRFAGQEPFCQITRQYNRAMEEILPQHGIEFIVFERKEVNSVPISASKVRELLHNKEFEELRMFVPESTYKYLIHHL